MKAVNRVIKNTAILYIRMAITVFISLYATRILLASLGTDDFGIFAVIGSAVAMLGFLNGSMSSASQRFMSYAHGQKDRNRQIEIFNTSFLIHLSVGFIMAVVLELIGTFLFNGFLDIDPNRIEVAKLVYHFVVISTFFTVISVPYDAVIAARENMLFFAALSTLESLSKLAIALFVASTTSDKLVTYGLLMASMMFFLFTVRALFCHSKYSECRFALKKYYSHSLVKEMTSFGGWSILGSFSTMFAYYGQGVVLNRFFGTAVNAAQGVAGQLNGQISTLAMTMLKALNPMIVKSEGEGNRDLMLNASMAGSKAGFFLLTFLCVPAIVEMPNLTSIWLGSVPDFAVVFCTLLLLKGLVEQLYITMSISIGAVGDIRAYQIATSIIAICPLVISYLLFMESLPPWGMYVVFLVFSFFRLSIVLYFMVKKCGLVLKEYISNVLLRAMPAFLVSLSATYTTSHLFEESVVRLLITLLLASVYSLTSVWLIGLTRREKKIVLKALYKLAKKSPLK